MSSRCRLILLSGAGGSGTTALAAATALALRDEGLRVREVDASGTLPADPEVLAAIGSSLGRVFAELGGDALPAEAWSPLPGVTHLTALAHLVRAVSDGGNDAVVVDCGDHRWARELLEMPAVALRLLDAAMTPRLAMWRSAAPKADDAVFDALSRARADILRMRDLLLHPATTMRLVTVATPDAVQRTAAALSAFALLGVGVDGIIVNRFPRKSDGWPKPVVAEQEQSLRLMQEQSDGVAVWKSTSTLRPMPKGRSAMGPLGRVRVLDEEQLTVRVGDEEFTLDIALSGPARRDATVGISGEHLVVAYAGVLRWLALPPVLRRCQPTHAVRGEDGLQVTFVPDPAMWRQPAAGMAS